MKRIEIALFMSISLIIGFAACITLDHMRCAKADERGRILKASRRIDEVNLLARMKQIIIPEMTFRQASVEDVLRCLQEMSAKGDDKRINMLLNFGPTEVTTFVETNDPFADPRDPFAEAVSGDPGTRTYLSIPTITIIVKQMSLYNAISVVCAAADLQWSVVGESVAVRPDDPKGKSEDFNPIPRETEHEIAVLRETLEDTELEVKNHKQYAEELRAQLPPLMGKSVLDRTIVPEVNFRAANIEDAANALTKAAQEYAPPTPTESIKIRKDMAAKLLTEAKQIEAYLDQKPLKAIVLDIPDDVDVPLVTFMARYITLRELLDISTEVSNLEYEFKDSIITIRPR